MNTNEISVIAKKALPGLASESLTYNAEQNLWHTMGWTSGSGNTYLKVYRICKGLALVFDVGIGDVRVFLNGVAIFGFDGDKPRLLAADHWGGVGNWMDYTDMNTRIISSRMLSKFLLGEAKKNGMSLSESEARAYADKLVGQTFLKCLN